MKIPIMTPLSNASCRFIEETNVGWAPSLLSRFVATGRRDETGSARPPPAEAPHLRDSSP
jgi:hypothetical protein